MEIFLNESLVVNIIDRGGKKAQRLGLHVIDRAYRQGKGANKKALSFDDALVAVFLNEASPVLGRELCHIVKPAEMR
jgi:hypothetical protein